MLKNIILVNEKQQSQLQERVQEVEKKLNIEIVPMLVARSAPIGHVKTILILIFIGIVLLLNPYESIWLTPTEHVVVVAISLLVFVVLTYFLSKSFLVQRILTSNADEIEMVQRRAEYEFFKSDLHHTKRRNAIMLFISRMEQRAHIVVDKGLDQKVSDEQRKMILEPLVQNLNKHHYFEAFMSALNVLEQTLEKSDGSHSDELSNKITIKD